MGNYFLLLKMAKIIYIVLRWQEYIEIHMLFLELLIGSIF